jgi:hypothetical protein
VLLSKFNLYDMTIEFPLFTPSNIALKLYCTKVLSNRHD